MRPSLTVDGLRGIAIERLLMSRSKVGPSMLEAHSQVTGFQIFMVSDSSRLILHVVLAETRNTCPHEQPRRCALRASGVNELVGERAVGVFDLQAIARFDLLARPLAD